MSFVTMTGLGRCYRGVIRALTAIDISIAPGEKVALLGPSGSGKSTLLSIIAGFECPDEGHISVGGRPLSDWPVVEYRTRIIGILFQQYHLLESLSASQNVELALFPTCTDPTRRRALSQQLLERVGLGERVDARANRLSGGERQRVAFCRSIVNGPRLLLADEPTGSLDSASKRLLLRLLHDWIDTEQRTLIVATHDTEVAAGCDRIIQLRDGRVVVS